MKLWKCCKLEISITKLNVWWRTWAFCIIGTSTGEQKFWKFKCASSSEYKCIIIASVFTKKYRCSYYKSKRKQSQTQIWVIKGVVKNERGFKTEKLMQRLFQIQMESIHCNFVCILSKKTIWGGGVEEVGASETQSAEEEYSPHFTRSRRWRNNVVWT